MIAPKQIPERRKAGETKKTMRPRWLLKSLFWYMGVFFLIQIVLILGLAWLLRALDGKMEAANGRINDQNEHNQALAVETKDLKNQVQNLHELISSQAAVDIIYLKILILKPGVDHKLAGQIAAYIHQYAILYDQDPDLVLSIMATESAFKPDAVSYAGAVGLMQIMPQWKKVLGIKGDLTDPETSVKHGLQILGFYREMYKDLDLVLTAYNRGPGPVDMALMRKKDPKNGYSDKVLKVYDRLKEIELKGYVGNNAPKF